MLAFCSYLGPHLTVSCSLASLSSLTALTGTVLAGTAHESSLFLGGCSVSVFSGCSDWGGFLLGLVISSLPSLSGTLSLRPSCVSCVNLHDKKQRKASTCKYTQISGLETVIIFTRQMIIIVGGEPGVHGAMWHAKQEGGLCL